MNNYMLSKYADHIKSILNDNRVILSYKISIDQNNNISSSAIAEIYSENENKYNTITAKDIYTLINEISYLIGLPPKIEIGKIYLYIIENKIGEVSILKVKITEIRGETFKGEIIEVINDCSGNWIYEYLYKCKKIYAGSIKYLYEIKKSAQ